MSTVRLSNKLITDTLLEVIGEDSIVIYEFLKAKKNISEFVISEKTGVEIHQVRNILYRMHNHNIASYKRKKDSKKGYYISYWTFHPKRIKEVISNQNKLKLDKLKDRLSKEEKNEGGFFMCSSACSRLDFESSFDVDFKCPECGSLLQQQDNQRTIEFLRDRIKEMEAVA